MKNQPSKGVFWDIDGFLSAFPFIENMFDSGLANSGDTYVHKRLWPEINPKGKAVLYMNANVDEALISEIIVQFGLTEYPKIVYDNSNHYKCHLDEGWKADRWKTIKISLLCIEITTEI